MRVSFEKNTDFLIRKLNLIERDDEKDFVNQSFNDLLEATKIKTYIGYTSKGAVLSKENFWNYLKSPEKS